MVDDHSEPCELCISSSWAYDIKDYNLFHEWLDTDRNLTWEEYQTSHCATCIQFKQEIERHQAIGHPSPSWTCVNCGLYTFDHQFDMLVHAIDCKGYPNK